MSEHVGTSATFARPPKSSGTSTEETCETDAEMWDFCLRAWMQAEPLPRGAVKGKTDQSKPGGAASGGVLEAIRTEGPIVGHTVI